MVTAGLQRLWCRLRCVLVAAWAPFRRAAGLSVCGSVLLSLGLSGCAALTAFGVVPSAEFSLRFASSPPADAVLGCVRSSILALSPQKTTQIADGVSFTSRQGNWATDVTAYDLAQGLLETGDYPQANRQGLRVRAVYTRATATLQLQLKAAGPYGADLGVQAQGSVLVERVTRCVGA